MKTKKKLRIHAFYLLSFLFLQYLLGMLTNLYVTFPNGTDFEHWDFAKTQILLMAHIVLGMLLLIGSIILYIRAIRARDKVWKIASGISLGAILLAIMSGSEFISSQDALFSLSMSLLFVIAVSSYGWGIYKSKK